MSIFFPYYTLILGVNFTKLLSFTESSTESRHLGAPRKHLWGESWMTMWILSFQGFLESPWHPRVRPRSGGRRPAAGLSPQAPAWLQAPGKSRVVSKRAWGPRPGRNMPANRGSPRCSSVLAAEGRGSLCEVSRERTLGAGIRSVRTQPRPVSRASGRGQVGHRSGRFQAPRSPSTHCPTSRALWVSVDTCYGWWRRGGLGGPAYIRARSQWDAPPDPQHRPCPLHWFFAGAQLLHTRPSFSPCVWGFADFSSVLI